ncbi:hypothetical protein LTR62_000161 [Meristemomyces frigidus]|uniref:BOD1/SHG1 domain-containing protein n=1 Tax=Meristemomyces frigidus TaxID=1508187 RepID=A0AAN7TJ67_9PEZI|nr:hypothetical protein LTR62_000161 [Meristemomyces frigidus]
MAADTAMSGTNDFELPARKKPKVSDLPLSSVQRASIDGMLHTFKKKGEFDGLRKKVFQQYNESAQRGMFEAVLRSFTIAEIERDPVKYLKPDRRMGAPLLEGAAARGNVYKKTVDDIDAYIDQHLASAEKALREIRRKDIGDEDAGEELQRGNKSEAEYAAESHTRREERAKQHIEQERLRKKKEAQERKKKEFEALKKKQAELMLETERLQREQKRRAEREAWKAAEKQRERDRIQKFNEDREKAKKEAEEREKAVREEREKRVKERADREQKRLEQEALDLLLREGEKMAERGKRPELERSESMEPPSRLLRQQTSRTSELRAQGLIPTSMTLRKGDSMMSAPTGPRAGSTPRGPAADDDRRPRASRPARRSPSPARALDRRTRDPSRDDDRRTTRRDGARRETLYRDISAEREAWKARQQQRPPARNRSRGSRAGGEEGEVVEGPPREPRGAAARIARSRSRDSNAHAHRPNRHLSRSRSPPRRRYRDESLSRSPPRYGRRRDESSPKRRERSPARRGGRSRSPPGIDRYVPGGGAGGVAAPPRRSAKDEEDRPARRRVDENRAAAPRRRADDDDKDERRSREVREYDRPRVADSDRYLPGAGRVEDADKLRSRVERSRSRERWRERSRDRDDDAVRERPRERGGERKRPRLGEREKSSLGSKAAPQESAEARGEDVKETKEDAKEAKDDAKHAKDDAKQQDDELSVPG